MTHENTCDVELGARCLDILVETVSSVDAERFIAYINREKMDYTRWQRNPVVGETIDEIVAQARAVGARQRGKRLGVRTISTCNRKERNKPKVD